MKIREDIQLFNAMVQAHDDLTGKDTANVAQVVGFWNKLAKFYGPMTPDEAADEFAILAARVTHPDFKP